MPASPSVARVKSCATAVSAPPRIAPWLLPSRYSSSLSSADFPAKRKASLAANPCGFFIKRPRNRFARNPCWIRSGIDGKLERSCSAVTALGTSSSAMPTQLVAQYAMSLFGPHLLGQVAVGFGEVAEQAVAVDRHAGGLCRRRRGQVAEERRRERAGLALGPAVRVEHESTAGLAAVGQVERRLERALDPPADELIRILGDLRDRERRARPSRATRTRRRGSRSSDR